MAVEDKIYEWEKVSGNNTPLDDEKVGTELGKQFRTIKAVVREDTDKGFTDRTTYDVVLIGYTQTARLTMLPSQQIGFPSNDPSTQWAVLGTLDDDTTTPEKRDYPSERRTGLYSPVNVVYDNLESIVEGGQFHRDSDFHNFYNPENGPFSSTLTPDTTARDIPLGSAGYLNRSSGRYGQDMVFIVNGGEAYKDFPAFSTVTLFNNVRYFPPASLQKAGQAIATSAAHTGHRAVVLKAHKVTAADWGAIRDGSRNDGAVMSKADIATNFPDHTIIYAALPFVDITTHPLVGRATVDSVTYPRLTGPDFTTNALDPKLSNQFDALNYSDPYDPNGVAWISSPWLEFLVYKADQTAGNVANDDPDVYGTKERAGLFSKDSETDTRATRRAWPVANDDKTGNKFFNYFIGTCPDYVMEECVIRIGDDSTDIVDRIVTRNVWEVDWGNNRIGPSAHKTSGGGAAVMNYDLWRLRLCSHLKFPIAQSQANWSKAVFRKPDDPSSTGDVEYAPWRATAKTETFETTNPYPSGRGAFQTNWPVSAMFTDTNQRAWGLEGVADHLFKRLGDAVTLEKTNIYWLSSDNRPTTWFNDVGYNPWQKFITKETGPTPGDATTYGRVEVDSSGGDMFSSPERVGTISGVHTITGNGQTGPYTIPLDTSTSWQTFMGYVEETVTSGQNKAYEPRVQFQVLSTTCLRSDSLYTGSDDTQTTQNYANGHVAYTVPVTYTVAQSVESTSYNKFKNGGMEIRFAFGVPDGEEIKLAYSLTWPYVNTANPVV